MVADVGALLNRAFKFDGGRTRLGGAAGIPSASGPGPSEGGRAGTAGGDSLVLSEPLKALMDLGMDLEGSSFASESQTLTFNLQFKDEHISTLTSSGSFDLRSRSLQVDFSFRSALTVKDEATGEEHQELFQFDFHLEASHVQSLSTDQKVEKEDILHFARKIVESLSKLYSEGKQIDGLVLDSDDLKDLASVDKGRLLKSIMSIIALMRSVDRLSGKKGEHVWLTPERGKALVKEERQEEEQSSTLSLSVKRVSTDVVRSSEIEALVVDTPAAEADAK